jgi:phage-related protein
MRTPSEKNWTNCRRRTRQNSHRSCPAQVDDYGNGLYRLRHIKPAYQGRLLFFASDCSAGFERLVMLVVYKKQGQKAPQHILETAKRRKKQWEDKRRKT